MTVTSKMTGVPHLEDTERTLLELQTGRNLRGLELERAGRADEAMALYEQNLAEGFAGDWPYGRLVSYYTARGRLHDVVRVLERGIAVLEQSQARTPSDRKALQQVFRRRLREAKRALQLQEGPAGQAPSGGQDQR